MTSLDEVFREAKEWTEHIEENEQEDIVRRILGYMERVQELTPKESSEVISISLHDMKTFNKLTNLLIVEGIYPSLSEYVGVPLAQRSKDVKEAKCIKSRDPGGMLQLIVAKLVSILSQRGDVRDLLLLGTYTADFLAAAIELGYNPDYSSNTKRRDTGRRQFVEMTKQMDTYALFTYYSSLLRPNQAPKWFNNVVSRQLALLPILRTHDGVKSLIEFVSGMRDKDQISLQELDHATRILKSIPRGVPIDEYCDKIGTQLFEILANHITNTNSSMVSSTVYIIHNLYEEAPNILKGFENTIIGRIAPKSSSAGSLKDSSPKVDEDEVDKALQVVACLLKNPHDCMMGRIIPTILQSLWVLYCYLDRAKRPKNTILALIQSIVKANSRQIQILLKSLLVQSIGDYVFGPGPNGGIEIRPFDASSQLVETMDLITQLDKRVDLLVGIIADLDDSIVSNVFVQVIRRWLVSDKNTIVPEDESPFVSLANVKILEKLTQDHKSKLMKSPSEIIEVLGSILAQYALKLEDAPPVDANNADSDDEDELEAPPISSAKRSQGGLGACPQDDDSDDEDEEAEQLEIVSLSLSLISGIAMEDIEDVDRRLLTTLTPQLKSIVAKAQETLRFKAQNALQFIGDPTTTENETTDKSSSETLKKALKSLEDPLVPIKAHGLHLLRGLIEQKDSVLPFDTAVQILMNQVDNEDSFIYLNTIKCLETLADVYTPPRVLPILLGYYSDGEVELDSRLRTGEVLLRVVQRMNKTFVGQCADMLVETMVSIISNSSGNDDRLRMSAMSILSMTCEINPMGVSQTNMMDAVDCSVGVLTFEKAEIMRRSAVVLIASLVKGLDSLDWVPRQHLQTVLTRIEHAKHVDDDPLVRSQAGTVLELIQDKRMDELGI
ncbi:hypothetical protein TRICI_006626 [Trichomonascus ciferrii]|uniref:Glycine radical domain-containing protein n=1 Tax=Trichomonascus ciferrii TaxID=44093 RepID=A0A642UJ48_9ASCO|nr:hypothetical protein TRICI_006626 [Trichomonascus ciferrii]